MLKKILFCLLLIQGTACAELQDVANRLPGSGTGIPNADIAAGLRQALNFGIDKQVSKLARPDGFFRNELVKILLPEELRQVDRSLRNVGLGNLADEGLKVLNRAAEEAVSEAGPIFVDAVKGITFNDARAILMGNDTAATEYLHRVTRGPLYQKFLPIIRTSFEKVGADQVWNNIISRYNALPLTNDVNPDLTDYVTGEALDGVYTMIAIEEKEIRTSLASRTTDLLKRVFALQD